jgi:segregation and condensation protein A
VDITEKPFWLRPPYVILFDLLRLHRIKPWDVNITYLLNTFLAEMKKQGFIDFSASGTALLSSSMIHRMKSELVLKMEEPPKPPIARPNEEVPPPLPFPIRFEYTSTSIEQVLTMLEEVLKRESFALAERKSLLSPPEILEQMDEFLANIEKNIEIFYATLLRKATSSSTLSFIQLAKEWTYLDAVRAFIMLLFLVMQNRVTLSQKEEQGDITIGLPEVATTVV